MIQRLSHSTIWVIDQDSAYDFYVNKLGFDVKTDAKMDGGFRWLTVAPKGQPDMEIILMPIAPGPMMDEASCVALKEMVRGGKLGAGVFNTADCHKTYEELKAKGVEFSQEPTEKFYGIEALFKDDSGNWFSLSQHKEYA
jgi:predicted enzyme related to lactoylglutathione lyase